MELSVPAAALGMEAGQLPVIKQPEATGLKVYPSPEKRSTVQTPVGDIQAVEEVSLVLVPTSGGELTIPEIRIPWFNTKTGKSEEAFLPAKTISIQGEALPQPTATVKPAQQPTKPKPQEIPSKPQKQQPAQADTPPYAIIGWTGLGVLGGLLIGFFYRRKKHRSYRLTDETARKNRKKRKPVPDLYPF